MIMQELFPPLSTPLTSLVPCHATLLDAPVLPRWKILSADASAEQDDYNRALAAKEKDDMEGWLKSLQEVRVFRGVFRLTCIRTSR